MRKHQSNNAIIEKFSINGINHPLVKFTITTKNKYNVYIQTNNGEYQLDNDYTLGRDELVNKIKNGKPEEVSTKEYSKEISKNSKNIKVIICNSKTNERETVYEIKTNLLKRIFTKIKMTIFKFKNIIPTIKKVIRYLKKSKFKINFKQNIASLKNNLNNVDVNRKYYDPLIEKEYQLWLKENEQVEITEKLSYEPLLTILTEVDNNNINYFNSFIDSILQQTYPNFELIIINNQGELNISDKRIKIIKNKNINDCINISNGEYLSIIPVSSVLEKDSLYYVAKDINKDRSIDLIYSDEDILNESNKRIMPHFKPNFSPDTLLSFNYINNLTFYKTINLQKIEFEYFKETNYNLILKYTNKYKNIKHIPKILFHSRITNYKEKYYLEKTILENHLKNNNIHANIICHEDIFMFELEYLYQEEPKVSIVIPTKDRADVLNTCLESIYNKTKYTNYEIVVINNNSVLDETFELLNKYQNEHSNFRYLNLNCEFNYSYINNEAVKTCNSEFIVFLNNDIEILCDNWLNKMVGYAMQEHIGCVGIKLLYPNNSVQHGGVLYGVGGAASHAFLAYSKDDNGYFGRLRIPYNYGAVTAACLMISREKFNKANGFDEKLKVAYNDVDLNLKMLDKNYYNIFLPSVVAYHYESLSRGSDATGEKRKRFNNENHYLVDKWQEKVLYDDFYNDNLSYYYSFHLDRKDHNHD